MLKSKVVQLWLNSKLKLDRTAIGSWANADQKKRKQWLQNGRVPSDYPDPVAADYPECLQIVRERVKPQRDQVRRQAHKKYGWHYGDKRPALYQMINSLSQVLVKTRVSDKFALAYVPKGWVYNERLAILAFDDFANFLILQSAIHEIWARSHASSLKMDMLYNPSSCFETFPFPRNNLASLGNLGETYHKYRRKLTFDRQEGLTDTYNHFHDPDETAQDIARLRQLHVEMDNAVAATYGWQDLELGHDFHETAQGIRYTISEAARREVLTRLLQLNHQRYEEEVKLGLHDKKGKKPAPKSKPKKTSKRYEGQMSFFDDD